MVITIAKTKTFTPDFNSNKTAAAADQIVVTYKNPTISIRDRVKSKPETMATADMSGRIEGINITIKSDDIATLREMLISINNAYYEDEAGNRVAVSNAKTLIEAPIEFFPLLQEIVSKFNEELDRSVVNEKN